MLSGTARLASLLPWRRRKSAVDTAEPLDEELPSDADRLLGEIARLGREQLRVTTLLDGQTALLEELAETWNAQLARQEREAIELRQALSGIEEQVRRHMVIDLLPVVDALDASVRAARQLLVEGGCAPAGACASRSSALALLLIRLVGSRATRSEAEAAWSASLESWLQGLLLIERRLLAVLERRGVRSMAVIRQPFDPHRHIAVAVRDADGLADGTVLGEEVRGFMFGNHVLRHAEVVVKRGRAEPPATSQIDHNEE